MKGSAAVLPTGVGSWLAVAKFATTYPFDPESWKLGPAIRIGADLALPREDGCVLCSFRGGFARVLDGGLKVVGKPIPLPTATVHSCMKDTSLSPQP